MTALSGYYVRPPARRRDSLTAVVIVAGVIAVMGLAVAGVGWLAEHAAVIVVGAGLAGLAFAVLASVWLLRQEARDRERQETELVTPDCGHRTMRRHLRWRGVGTCCAACAAQQRIDLITQSKGAA